MKPPEILLVNDEPVQRRRLARLLQKAGYQVLEAEDGLQALEKIEAGLDPDLVVTDLYMPRLDGWQLCREIRERGLSVPILVVSAFFEGEEIEDLLKALGVNDFLRSPVERQEFLKKVAALLRGESALQAEQPFPLLFLGPKGLNCAPFEAYLEQTGFRVTRVRDIAKAQDLLKVKTFPVALVCSHFSPDEVLSLRCQAPKTTFLVLLSPDSPFKPFQYVLKGAKHVVPWPGEPEFVNYLCQRELREQALVVGQKLLRERTRELEKLSTELQRLRQVLHLVVEEAEMGIVVTDQALAPLFLNPSARNILRTLGVEDFGQFLREFLGPDPSKELWQRFEQDGRYSCEVQWPKAEKILVFTVKPLFEKEGFSRLVFFIQDVTQEREWQKRLAQVQKMEALATLTAGIAHDFNNLIGAIRLKAELLLSKLSNGYRGYLSDIISICDRAARVVSQIMSVNKPSSCTEVTNLNFQVKETINFLQETIPKGIRLQVFLSVEPLLVSLDAGQLSQIIMNLCLNAVQAMGDQGVLLIRTGRDDYHKYRPDGFVLGAQEELNGPFAWIQVSDTGCGISPKVLPRIFDPYFSTKEQAGTGLGLAMTANIVKNAGGLIAVETALHHGTTFTIYLPVEEDVSLKEILPSIRREISRAPAKVLVVEDEDMIRESIQEFLESRGCRVMACRNGTEAIALLESGYNPDVAILDLNMPGPSGVEVARLIRQRKLKTKIVIATGRVEPEQARSLTELDIAQVLVKPFSLEDLYATLCQALGNCGGGSHGLGGLSHPLS